ncbi:MAG: pyridoxamine 5'-phosphate oxidase [Rhodobacteraceae bacterium TMED111]|nr:MAG: pyridoxamine 5'-phosphate oxidase [Rhodobacteraceae bacterium TMED111]|tara:strand:+ start:4776 stop:5372 length:597 start_codon:yes stop_codon:yes gene_type:complete
MIQFINLSKQIPYKIFHKKYTESLNANQRNIEAICISSYSTKEKEVNARFVNLKIVDGEEFIFFSNYKSPKSINFIEHPQITALFYWNTTNTQIRMKANIKKTSKEFNRTYFAERDRKKNALAISSKQSSFIESYEDVQKNYDKSLKSDDLKKCPDYWGGFSFKPYYFEFWEGHDSRLNKREIYELKSNEWMHSFLQP